jgi:hypothetical protein
MREALIVHKLPVSSDLSIIHAVHLMGKEAAGARPSTRCRWETATTTRCPRATLPQRSVNYSTAERALVEPKGVWRCSSSSSGGYPRRRHSSIEYDSPVDCERGRFATLTHATRTLELSTAMLPTQAG